MDPVALLATYLRESDVADFENTLDELIALVQELADCPRTRKCNDCKAALEGSRYTPSLAVLLETLDGLRWRLTGDSPT